MLKLFKQAHHGFVESRSLLLKADLKNRLPPLSAVWQILSPIPSVISLKHLALFPGLLRFNPAKKYDLCSFVQRFDRILLFWLDPGLTSSRNQRSMKSIRHKKTGKTVQASFTILKSCNNPHVPLINLKISAIQHILSYRNNVSQFP